MLSLLHEELFDDRNVMQKKFQVFHSATVPEFPIKKVFYRLLEIFFFSTGPATSSLY